MAGRAGDTEMDPERGGILGELAHGRHFRWPGQTPPAHWQ